MPIIKKHQTYLDFVTQHSGIAETLLDMAKQQGISITDDAVPGTSISCKVADSKIVDFYIKNGLNIATDYHKINGHALEGIGFWAVGLDFKVS